MYWQTPYMGNSPYQQMIPQTAQNVQQTQQVIQNGGFVNVRSESEARNYPVAIGTSVTFKDENSPYIYNKTMGFSQFDTPRFDKYRLVKEDDPEDAVKEINPADNAIAYLQGQIEAIWSEIDSLKKKPVKPVASKKKEADDESN